MGENPNQFEDVEGPVDPRLREHLSALFVAPTPVPPAVDAQILAKAKAAFQLRLRRRRMARWLGTITSVAAAAIIAMVLFVHLSPPPQRMALMGDFNHDGHVDILDAYALAKSIASGKKLDAEWDLNHDGVIDQKDVDWIAATAVNVSEGAPQ